MEKISFHIIHANPTFLFENNITFGLFIETIIHFILVSIIEHKCSFFNINIDLKQKTVSELIALLSPHVNELRTQCINCHISNTNFNIREIMSLMVLNKQKQWSLAIDLNVYHRNQQFRLFDCVKQGKNNPLRQTTLFPFYNQTELLYSQVLTKSIITKHINAFDLPVMYFHSNHFQLEYIQSNCLPHTYLPTSVFLTQINIHLNTFFHCRDHLKSIFKLHGTNQILNQKISSSNLSQRERQQFLPFIQHLITSDQNHLGYIRSCVRGQKDTNLLFFNIGGNYRFCPRKQQHHQHNTVAILVHTKRLTYSIRCKDSECNRNCLNWTHLLNNRTDVSTEATM